MHVKEKEEQPTKAGEPPKMKKAATKGEMLRGLRQNCNQLIFQGKCPTYYQGILYTSMSIDFTALFNNMRILKFQSRSIIMLFTDVVNHCSGPLRKQVLQIWGQKVSPSTAIGGNRSTLFLCFYDFM